MTPEGSWELHEQRLRSIDDNMSRVWESHARASERQDRTERDLQQLTELRILLVQRHMDLTEEVRQLSSEVREYIRSLKDGRGQGN